MIYRLSVTVLLLSFCTLASAQERKATFYHQKFYGRLTSTGEELAADRFTAASKRYDWGTILEVTNLENGLKTQVRVNDCGPHAPGNVLDLSQAAARELKMIRAGRVNIATRVVRPSTAGPTCARGVWAKKLRAAGKDIPPPPPAWDPIETRGALPPEVITDTNSDVVTFPDTGAVSRQTTGDPSGTTGVGSPPLVTTGAASPTNAAPAAAPRDRKTPVKAAVVEFDPDVMLFGVKIGAFKSKENADKLVRAVEASGFAPAFTLSDGKYIRVYAGKFYFQSEAEKFQAELRKSGFPDATVRRVQ